MYKIFLLLLLCQAPFAYGQKRYPTALQLAETLTQNTEQSDGVYKSTTWFTVANDSSYQKADTVTFYTDFVYLLEKQVCTYVRWVFYSKDAFIIDTEQRCSEANNDKNEDEDPVSLRFGVSEDQQRLFLKVFDENILVDRFEVLSLTKQSLRNLNNEATDVLTLKRVALDEARQ